VHCDENALKFGISKILPAESTTEQGSRHELLTPDGRAPTTNYFPQITKCEQGHSPFHFLNHLLTSLSISAVQKLCASYRAVSAGRGGGGEKDDT